MSKPFDATTKYLLETQPSAWINFLGLTGSDVHVMNADLATVTTEADRVLYVAAPRPYIVHIEFQASYDSEMAERLLRYNVLLRYRHRLPVHSVVILLRRQADDASLTGVLEYAHPGAGDGEPVPAALSFRYDVVRIWNIPVANLLDGDIGVLPLAPISSVDLAELPSVISQMGIRIRGEASAADAGILWTAAYVLMGLKFPPRLTHELLKEVQGMEESLTYQEIVTKGRVEGRVEGERETLLRLARKRLGDPAPAVKSVIESIVSQDRLDYLIERVLQVESWDELLA